MARHSVPIIGLAGGIGSGKTTVARIMAQAGCVVADSDAAARAALADSQIRQRIVERWGGRVVDERGEIDRSALAAIVFGDSKERKVLESIVHPWVEQRRVEQFDSAARSAAGAGIPALVIDAPLLFEAGLDRTCDAVIFVDASRQLRRERVMQSRGWDEAELGKREASQMPLDQKRREADYIVHNTGSLEEVGEQVREVLATIVTAHREKARESSAGGTQ